MNYIDTNGDSSMALQWSTQMWWMCGIDLSLPVGDFIYFCGIAYLVSKADQIAEEHDSDNEVENDKKTDSPVPPNVEYPGDDPTVAPDGYEWRGPDEQGGDRGGYANKNGKDSWHPDLNHPDGIGPHWDYNDGLGNKWRVFKDKIEYVMKGKK